jgi:hypothetical protein
MEPLRDDELDALLRQGEPDWKPSPLLDVRVWERYRRRPWEWLWRGSIRIPVPVAVMLVVLAVLAWNRGARERPVEIDLSEFRPVERLEIKLVRSGNANQ